MAYHNGFLSTCLRSCWLVLPVLASCATAPTDGFLELGADAGLRASDDPEAAAGDTGQNRDDDQGPTAAGGITAVAGSPSTGSGGSPSGQGGTWSENDGGQPSSTGGTSAEAGSPNAGGETQGGEAGSAGEAAGGSGGDGEEPIPEPFAATTMIAIDNVQIIATNGGNLWNSYDFTSHFDGFALSPYGSTPNVGADVGAEELSARSMLVRNLDDGVPAPSLQATVPFTASGEQIDFNRDMDQTDWDLTGYRVTARVKRVSGGTTGSDCPLRAWVYATSTWGSWYFAGSDSVDLMQSSDWITLTLDLEAPGDPLGPVSSHPSFDPSRVNQVGVQIYTGSGNCP